MYHVCFRSQSYEYHFLIAFLYSPLNDTEIKRVYYGCGNEKFGGNGSVLQLNDKDFGRAYPSYGIITFCFCK